MDAMNKAGTEDRFSVTYYDAKASKRGQGVQTVTFTNKADAGTFASRNRLYGKPCAIVQSSVSVRP